MPRSARLVRVRNHDRFQHYRDRTPPWVKLHQTILEDYAFSMLPDAAKWHAIGCILLASRLENRIPYDHKWVATAIRANSKVNLDTLIDMGFLEFVTGDEPKAEKWSSRYIPDAVRASTYERDGHKCVACSSTERLEIDHILPISKGGDSAPGNLQVLCRSCNRRKRVSTDAEQVATQTNAPRSGVRRERREEERESRDREEERRNLALALEEAFALFWKEYPRKRDKPRARGVFGKAHGNGLPEIGELVEIVRAWAGTHDWVKDGGQFVPYPATWLKREGWTEELPAPPRGNGRDPGAAAIIEPHRGPTTAEVAAARYEELGQEAPDLRGKTGEEIADDFKQRTGEWLF